MTIYNKLKSSFAIPAIMVGLLVSSCSLEIEETDAIHTDEEAGPFAGVENPGAGVDNLYGSLSGQFASQEELYALSEVTTDLLLVPTRGTDWGDNGVWRTLHAHTWSPTHRDVLNVWNNKNGLILRATEIIHPLSEATAEQVAHAKFVRAYCMWIIMDGYGQVPFREATDAILVIPSVMTRTEAYDFIVQDLEDAIEGLPASNPTSDNKTRATKATARFLLARLKLNANVYKGSYGANDLQDVISLVNEIEADGYALVPNYFDIFVGPTFTNTDVIWNVSADVGTKMWNSLHYNQAHSGNGGGGWNGFTTLSEFYDKFEGPDDTNAIGSGQEERRGYTQTLESTNEDNEGFGFGFQFGQMYGFRDGEAVELTTRTGEPLIFTKELPGLIGNNEVTGIRLLKYSPANGSFTSGTVIFRFADAHLMRAEAMMRANTGDALAEVNELRAMRENTPPLASLSEEEMLDERGRELYLEYVRRMDMIRFGKFDDAWEFKEAGDGHTNLFPIPSNALLSNPNLVQNPGY